MRLCASLIITFLLLALGIYLCWDYIEEPEPLISFVQEDVASEPEPAPPPVEIKESDPEPTPTESGWTNAVIIEEPEVLEEPKAVIPLPEIEAEPDPEPSPPPELTLLPFISPVTETEPKRAWSKPGIIIDLDWIRQLRKEDL